MSNVKAFATQDGRPDEPKDDKKKINEHKGLCCLIQLWPWMNVKVIQISWKKIKSPGALHHVSKKLVS